LSADGGLKELSPTKTHEGTRRIPPQIGTSPPSAATQSYFWPPALYWSVKPSRKARTSLPVPPLPLSWPYPGASLSLPPPALFLPPRARRTRRPASLDLRVSAADERVIASNAVHQARHALEIASIGS